MDIRRVQALKDGENVIGNRTRVKVVKNKMAPPFKEVEFDILYGEGISKEGDILDLAANLNVIEKSGTWYTYKDERVGQGRENARNFLKQNPEICARVRAEALAKAGVGQNTTAATAAANAPAGATAAGPAVPASAMNAKAEAAAPAKKAEATKPAASAPSRK
jgi:recombination protein RecA